MSAQPLRVLNPFAVLIGSRPKQSPQERSNSRQRHHQSVSITKRHHISPVTPIFHARTIRDLNRLREGRKVHQIFAQNTITAH